MSDDHIELILKWIPGAATAEAAAWLSDRGLTALPMKQGLLVSGRRSDVERAFSVDLSDANLPYQIPIPAELSGNVASITLPKPRSYHF
jgi:hypothetical protein